jgi:hypothetical protein
MRKKGTKNQKVQLSKYNRPRHECDVFAKEEKTSDRGSFPTAESRRTKPKKM